MDARFRAFTFVDRIHAVRPGDDIQGRYAVPSDIEKFPPALVAEAVGQLAAWSAMAALDFRSRPVAGLAAGIEVLTAVRPGDVLELTAHLERLDDEAVAYSGSARLQDSLVLRLEHAVGPMLPAEQFDDPETLRQHFNQLRTDGVPPGAFRGLPWPTLEPLGGEPGRSLRASLSVPVSAPFFDDHFPRRPVFPGSLLMHCNLELALRLAAVLPTPQEETLATSTAEPMSTVDHPGAARRDAEPYPADPCADGAHASRGAEQTPPTVPSRRMTWAARRVTDVKVRAFTAPGEVLRLEARLERLTAAVASVTVETRLGSRTIGGARIHFSPESVR